MEVLGIIETTLEAIGELRGIIKKNLEITRNTLGIIEKVLETIGHILENILTVLETVGIFDIHMFYIAKNTFRDCREIRHVIHNLLMNPRSEKSPTHNHVEHVRNYRSKLPPRNNTIDNGV